MAWFVRVLCSGLLITQAACSGEREGLADAAGSVRAICSDAGAGCVSLPDATLVDAAPPTDAQTPLREAAAAADAAPQAHAAAPTDAAPPTATDSGSDVAIPFSYGPCPTMTHCDPLMAPIAQPLIAAYDPHAPLGVTACVPDAFVITAVPACYAPGPCEVGGNKGGVCLGMAPPHEKTGYCVLACR
jgi:hypothetical protein